jgi:hypothetical protein
MKRRKVVEELCQDDKCGRANVTHWHPLDVEDLRSETDGEYTIIVRVRTVGGKKRRPAQKDT